LKEIRILDEEWDILVVLDACRYDAFNEINNIKGNLEPRRSLGSTTEEWFRENFKEDGRVIKRKDIVYISGNPYVSEWKIVEGKLKFGYMPFYILIEVWDWAWDSERNAVPPEPVTRAALDAIKKYRDKKFIIHYLQPHSPFLKTDIKVGRGLLRDYLQDKKKRFLTREELSKLQGMVWEYVGNEVSVEDVRLGYVSNLIYVLSEVEKLISEIPRKKRIIITSDHGEMLGFPNESFGHGFIDHPSLRTVPWFRVRR
jgi:hypothetical protein